MNMQARPEQHFVTRLGWLRAAVLGANDGVLSTAAILVGVAAADPGARGVLIAGGAAMVAGAMSMAAGEYVSVSSQADSEKADIAREAREIREMPEFEEAELARVYRARGLSPATAALVARELSAGDALGAHVRDELGLSEAVTARPLQAALTSALTFLAGAAMPLLAALLAPAGWQIPVVFLTTLATLGLLGALGARAGGAPMGPAVLRVGFWGAAAMIVTAGIGRVFGVIA